ncbi:MAG: MMPL family transporter [Bacteroides sp.]|nr:MMPL family transporter [Bacteroides sp.]
MTRLFIDIYRFLRRHRAVMWCSMLLLLFVSGWFATRIHLEEDLNKLMPSSKNEDGTTKLAFSNLKIKDKTFLLFEAMDGASPEELVACCDEFVDSLVADNEALASDRVFSDIFHRLDEDVMPAAIDYLSRNIPAYVDTALYGSFDTLLTEEHMLAQMQRNASDFDTDLGSLFPELIEMDPIGMRDVLASTMKDILGAGGGGMLTLDNHFFVPDSSVCMAFVSPQFSATNTGQGNRMFEIINNRIAEFASSYPNVHICYYGTPAYGYYNSTTIKGDLVGTVAWSEILVLLLLFLCMRNWNTIPLLFLPVAFGTLFGLAVMYFIKGQFSLMALGIGAIVLGVAMSYVLHILVHYKYTGDAEQVLKDETKPVLLGCVTTIGSFIGLLFVQTDLLQDFGLFAALAIVGTTVFALIYLPHLMELEKNKVNHKAFAFIDRINTYAFHEKKWLLGMIAVLTLFFVSAYVYKGTSFDSDMNKLGYVEEEVGYASRLHREKTATGYGSTYFASQGRSMEEALENFAVLDAKLDSLQKEGLVRQYTPIARFFVPMRVQQERIDAWHRFWTPERLERVRMLIDVTAPTAGLNPEGFEAFFDMVTDDYVPVPLYEAGIIPEGYLSTILEQTWNGEYLCLTNVKYEGKDDFTESSDFLKICNAVAKEPDLLVLSTAYYTQDTLSALNSDFNILQWMSMAFVFVVLFVSFGFNLWHTVIGFAPILFSWLIVLGAMAVFDVQFNLINIIISTFIFGIGVDYSIFVMNGLIADSSRSGGGNDAMLHFHKTAIAFSAMILIVTVASMLFARHPAIQSVGFATLVGMIAAVILSYVCQPALFRWMKKHANASK